jgi:UDP-N-acetylmuramyl tripeptide synthase
VIVNRDDAALAALSFAAPVVGFSTRRPADWHIVDGAIAHRGRPLLRIDEVPLTFGGAAAYNVANVLGAAALAASLGVPDDAIVSALRSFDRADNPGRGNVQDVSGITVVLDFAHNADGVRGLMALVASLRRPGSRLFVVLGLPGDRRDEAIVAVASEVAAARPARVLLHDLVDYLRGREPGAVPAMLRSELVRHGVSVDDAGSELGALEQTLAAAASGDVVVLFPMLDPTGVAAVIDRRLRATIGK